MKLFIKSVSVSFDFFLFLFFFVGSSDCLGAEGFFTCLSCSVPSVVVCFLGFCYGAWGGFLFYGYCYSGFRAVPFAQASC